MQDDRIILRVAVVMLRPPVAVPPVDLDVSCVQNRTDPDPRPGEVGSAVLILRTGKKNFNRFSVDGLQIRGREALVLPELPYELLGNGERF